MSVQVLCPSCGNVAELHRPPVTECVRCGAALPGPMREATERALRREQTPKPLLLVLGQRGSLFAGALFVFALLLAPSDSGTFTIDGETVSGPEFLRRVGWVFGLIGAVLLAIGVGLWREKGWARPLIVFYWVALLAFSLADLRGDAAQLAMTAILHVGVVGFTTWYLYRKPNVRAYFEARADPAPVHDDA